MLKTNSNAAVWRPPRSIDATDVLGILFVFAFVCLGAILTPLQVAEYRGEQAAIAAFTARQTLAPVLVEPLFNFADHVRFINGVAGGIFSLSIELLLIWWRRPVARLVNACFLPRIPSAAITNELRAIRQTLERLADTRPTLSPRANRSIVYTDEVGLGPAELRASAERCFRLAQGAVSLRLAEELERLGQDFEHEARRLERVFTSHPVDARR